MNPLTLAYGVIYIGEATEKYTCALPLCWRVDTMNTESSSLYSLVDSRHYLRGLRPRQASSVHQLFQPFPRHVNIYKASSAAMHYTGCQPMQ